MGGGKDLNQLDRFHIKKKGFSFINSGFFIFSDDNEELLYVDIPDFKLVKHLDFYVDASKTAKLFWVKQDKVIFATTAEYTLYIEGDKPIAKYRAELKDNLFKRNVKILSPNDDHMCNLVEKSAVGGLLGGLAGGDFVFVDGDESLGTFYSESTNLGSKKYSLDLVVELGRKLDARIALAAVIILYGRLI